MHKQTLNLPPFAYNFKTIGGKACLYDAFRRKYVVITPEEWVRQHLLHYLVADKAYPAHLISVEKLLVVEGSKRRYDAVVFDDQFHPLLLIECKAPHVAISQEVFDQAARYNRPLQVPFFLVSNGLQHIMAKVDHANGRYLFAPEPLTFKELQLAF